MQSLQKSEKDKSPPKKRHNCTNRDLRGKNSRCSVDSPMAVDHKREVRRVLKIYEVRFCRWRQGGVHCKGPFARLTSAVGARGVSIVDERGIDRIYARYFEEIVGGQAYCSVSFN